MVHFLLKHHTTFIQTINKYLWKWMAKQDGNGLKLENRERFQQTFELDLVCPSCENSIDMFLLLSQEHFVCERRHLLISLLTF